MEGFYKWHVRNWRFKLACTAGFVAIFCLACLTIQATVPITVTIKSVADPNSYNTALGAAGAHQYAQTHPLIPLIYRPRHHIAKLPPGKYAPVIFRIQTREPVIFITIDDGVTKAAAPLRLLRDRRLVASLFLYDNAARTNYDYFKLWQRAGSTIENHTISHPHLRHLNYSQQHHQICGGAARLAHGLMTRPTLFRPPYGEYNQNTRRAAAACHMKAIVWWSVVMEKGKLRYQRPPHIRPGDIVLLHFTPRLASDLKFLLSEAKKHHLFVGQLEDWLH